jgi:hypothetical protein
LFDEASLKYKTTAKQASEMFENAGQKIKDSANQTSERTQAFVRGTSMKMQVSINDTNLKLFDA